LLIAMLKRLKRLKRRAIAAVDGIDMPVGSSDPEHRMGIPGEYNHAPCARPGRPPELRGRSVDGVGRVRKTSNSRPGSWLGMRYLTGGSDVGFHPQRRPRRCEALRRCAFIAGLFCRSAARQPCSLRGC
jgi:hypothetical protein